MSVWHPADLFPKGQFLRDLQPLLGSTGWLYETTWIAFLYRRRQKPITSVHEVKRKFSELRGGNPLMFLVTPIEEGLMLLRGLKWLAKDKAAASHEDQEGAIPQGAKIMDRNAKVTLPLKTCGLDYSLRCSTHHAGVVRVLLGYSF
jgi:hypothetical protein